MILRNIAMKMAATAVTGAIFLMRVFDAANENHQEKYGYRIIDRDLF